MAEELYDSQFKPDGSSRNLCWTRESEWTLHYRHRKWRLQLPLVFCSLA